MKTWSTVLITLSLLFCSSAWAARPGYPYPDAVGNNARHHIIPWKETVDFGMANFTSKDEMVGVISLLMTRHPNLGEYASPEALADGVLNQQNAALETWQGLLAWLPGNLVIGPQNRPNDPGEQFDVTALTCLKTVDADASYTDIFTLWRQASATVAHKKIYLLKMARATMADARGRPCWNN